MIYDSLPATAPLRQGDIFVGLPRIDIKLDEIAIAGAEGPEATKWEDIATTTEPVNAIVSLRPVTCIVATQDCDASRSRDITLCEIREFAAVEGKAKNTVAARSWVSIITQHARINLKWFYMPPDPALQLDEKMAVDFSMTMRVLRSDLELLFSLRKGRLNSVACQHFRERISEFFRRYPYDEWYALNKDELAAYTKDYPGTTPFAWQK